MADNPTEHSVHFKTNTSPHFPNHVDANKKKITTKQSNTIFASFQNRKKLNISYDGCKNIVIVYSSHANI